MFRFLHKDILETEEAEIDDVILGVKARLSLLRAVHTMLDAIRNKKIHGKDLIDTQKNLHTCLSRLLRGYQKDLKEIKMVMEEQKRVEVRTGSLFAGHLTCPYCGRDALGGKTATIVGTSCDHCNQEFGGTVSEYNNMIEKFR
jgi:hypothetical protein